MTLSVLSRAVLDSGVQYDHPDLKGNVWHNPGEKKANGKDDDDNGYVDDYYGADVRDAKGSGGDTEGHGSHVAGIIGADGMIEADQHAPVTPVALSPGKVVTGGRLNIARALERASS